MVVKGLGALVKCFSAARRRLDEAAYPPYAAPAATLS